MDHLQERYVSVLLNEMRKSEIERVSSVYIGGGTPSVLPLELLEMILTGVTDLPLAIDAEISMEVNPGTVSGEFSALIKSKGVNRLSFGLQTTCGSQLALIGRVHTYEQFLENYMAARDGGFDNINVDLIFNLPGQELDEFEQTLLTVLALEPQHVSFYSLTPCENTPLYSDLSSGRSSLPDDETDRNMYHLASKLLAKKGYWHYEISNASKRGYECLHNIDCWQHKPYRGFGLGAHSFDGQSRWNNPSDFSDYFAGAKPTVELLSDEELISEAMILGLRLLDGVDELLFESKYGVVPSVFFGRQITKLVSDGLLEREDSRIRLTSLGLDLANRVFMQFLQEN